MTNVTEVPDVSSSTLPATIAPTNSSIDHDADKTVDGSLRFIIAPVSALGLICLVTVMVILFLRKKRLDRLRHHLMPFYNFDPGEEGEDWETELLEDTADFNRPNIKGYKTMEHKFSTHQSLLSRD